MPPSLMIQGTGSNVGKSVLVAGLCRAFKRRGLVVRPFKPQNMSNNAAVSEDGGEIGRAQALQAKACGVRPHTDMNPVLLKPESETGSQVILRGQRLTTVRAKDYAALKPTLLGACLESFERLGASADLVLVEGAGSPAEINLRTGDIANMGFAQAARVPVILAGDIDRGGVIAQLVGTQAVIDPADAALIEGFVVNKFRGDPSLFDDGYHFIEKRTGWRGFGVIPWFADAAKLPAEDALDLAGRQRAGALKIAVPMLSRIANFDDLDPLAMEDGVSLEMVPAGTPLPADAALVILPGSKSTIGDLAFLRAQGWDEDLRAILRRGGRILGICGGYQMLGKRISDPEGIEGLPGEVEGLGLLDVETVMTPQKRLALSDAQHLASNTSVGGYEIHIGQTSGPDCANPLMQVCGRAEGAISTDGRVSGTYLHGIFASDAFRAAFLSGLGAEATSLNYERAVDETLDALADHLETNCNLDGMLKVAQAQKKASV